MLQTKFNSSGHVAEPSDDGFYRPHPKDGKLIFSVCVSVHTDGGGYPHLLTGGTPSFLSCPGPRSVCGGGGRYPPTGTA